MCYLDIRPFQFYLLILALAQCKSTHLRVCLVCGNLLGNPGLPYHQFGLNNHLLAQIFTNNDFLLSLNEQSPPKQIEQMYPCQYFLLFSTLGQDFFSILAHILSKTVVHLPSLPFIATSFPLLIAQQSIFLVVFVFPITLFILLLYALEILYCQQV